MNSNAAISGYTYDGLGRVQTETDAAAGGPTVVWTLGYDAASNLLSRAETINGQAGATTSFTPDNLGRVTSEQQSGGGAAAKRADFTYNALGQVTTESFSANLTGTNPAVEAFYQYDGANRLTNLHDYHIVTGQPWTTLASGAWAYDAANRVTSQTNDGVTSTIGYDSASQLTSDSGSGQSFGYDAAGNRATATTGPYNRLMSDGTYTYTYDNEGNRLTRTNLSTGAVDYYTWDYHDRLTEVQTKNSAGTVTQDVHYTYDVNDQRIGKTVYANGSSTPSLTERYAYADGQLALVMDSTGNVNERYLDGPNSQPMAVDRSGVVQWLLADDQGTVRDVADANGTVIDHLTVDPFGVITGQTNAANQPRFVYTGQPYDPETGLYQDRARYYDPAAGRFLSEDPTGFSAGDPNLYRYVGNSVPNATDPSGLSPTLPTQTQSWTQAALGSWPVSSSPAETPNQVNENSAWFRSGVQAGSSPGSASIAAGDSNLYRSAGNSMSNAAGKFVIGPPSATLVATSPAFSLDPSVFSGSFSTSSNSASDLLFSPTGPSSPAATPSGQSGGAATGDSNSVDPRADARAKANVFLNVWYPIAQQTGTRVEGLATFAQAARNFNTDSTLFFGDPANAATFSRQYDSMVSAIAGETPPPSTAAMSSNAVSAWTGAQATGAGIALRNAAVQQKWAQQDDNTWAYRAVGGFAGAAVATTFAPPVGIPLLGMELDNLSSALTGEQPFTQTALRDVASFAGAPNPDRAGADLYTMAQFGLGAAGMMMASGSGASRGLAVGETNATTRVTQFYDPSRGGFGAGSADALTAPPTSWYKPLTRFGDGPVFGTATPRTWVSPFSAAEQNWWTRIMTGRPGYTNYVEFDVAASEMQSVGGLKGLAGLGRYQQFVPGPVSLSGRNPVFSQLGPNNGRWVFYGGLGLGLAGAGTATYWATRP